LEPPAPHPRAHRHTIVSASVEKRKLRLVRDKQRVAVVIGSGQQHLPHADARLGGHEGRQSLMLDLVEPTDRSTSGWIPVRQEPPAPGEPLRVLRVVAQDAHFEGLSGLIVTDVLGPTNPLLLCWRQVADRDSERLE
jgi:hypothetical protein